MMETPASVGHGATDGAPTAREGAPLRADTDRLPRVRRASLAAVARLRREPEPTPEECDAVSWDYGLAGAYRSLPRRRADAVQIFAAERAPPRYRPPLAWVPLVTVVTFAAMLVVTPVTALWETHGHTPPERTMGVPNAPDSPSFLVLARVWTLALSPVVSLDVALTLLALACTAALAAAAFLLFHRAFSGIVGDPSASWSVPPRWALPGAMLGVLFVVSALIAWAPEFPRGAVYYSTAVPLTVAAWMVLRWRDRRADPGSLRWLLGAGYLLVLGVTTAVSWWLPISCAALFVSRRALAGSAAS